MLKKMKFIMFAILFAQIFTLRAKKSETIQPNSDTLSANLTTVTTVYTQPLWYYYWSPVYYYYSPSYPFYWDFYGYWYDPYFIWFRKDGEKTILEKEDKAFNISEAKSELTQLRKNIWGKEDYSTENLRKDQKIYDPKWLIAQLKIARVVFLEDVSKDKKTRLGKITQSDPAVNKQNNSTNTSSQPYLYYTWTPVAYSSDPNNWFNLSYHDYWHDPYFWWFNKDSTEKNDLKKLKQSIWGKSNYSTESLRKEKIVYEPKWLIAQLKIARVALLEDAIKNQSSGSNSRISIKANIIAK